MEGGGRVWKGVEGVEGVGVGGRSGEAGDREYGQP